METRAIHLVPQRRGAGSCLDFQNGFSRRGMFSQKSLLPCAKLSRSTRYLRWNFTVEEREDEGDSHGRSPRPNCPWGSGGWVGGRQRWWWCKEGIIVRSHRANHEKNCSAFREAQNTKIAILLWGVASPIKLCVQLNPCSPKYILEGFHDELLELYDLRCRMRELSWLELHLGVRKTTALWLVSKIARNFES